VKNHCEEKTIMSDTPFLSFKDLSEEAHSEAIKWKQENTKYEVYTPILKSMDIGEMIPHIISIKSKVTTTVSEEDHAGPSLFEVFPRSLSIVLATIWEQVRDDALNNDETVANFDNRAKDLLAVHATSDDRYDLVQQLRAIRKPRELPVQAFWYKLKEFNSYIDWLPGTEPALTEGQLKQTFHDSMPITWRERFANAGNTVLALAMAEMVRYFRKQENQAFKKGLENTALQRKQAVAARRGKSKDNKSSPRKFEPSKKGTSTEKRSRIQESDPCPVHPGMGHTWGQCRANTYNKQRNEKKRKVNDTGSDANVVTVEAQPVANKSNDSQVVALNNVQSMDCGTFIPEYFVSRDCLNPTHHLDAIAFTAQQKQLNGSFSLNKTYSTVCDEVYSTGDNDLTIKTFTDVTQPLRLCAISVMTVGKIQNTENHKPLRVLFDTGSDRTMANF
jgi:hypothetical protein